MRSQYVRYAFAWCAIRAIRALSGALRLAIAALLVVMGAILWGTAIAETAVEEWQDGR